MPVNSFENYYMSWKPQIHRDGEVPLYIEIAQALERDVRSGKLAPNDKLPPQRELADFLDVNLSTIARAFKRCAAKGIIAGEIGRGTYVSGDVASNLSMLDHDGLENCIDLGASHPVYDQNTAVVQALKHVVKRTNIEKLLEYGEISGRVAHRQSGQLWLAQHGLNVTAENILITSGLQNALAIVLTSLFRFGDKIATSTVVYPGIKNLAHALGIQLIAVPDEGENMNPAALKQLLVNEHIKGIYLMPDHHNPTAVYMGEDLRMKLAEMIHAHNLICIEDATYSFLSGGSHTPITSLVPAQSIYIATVSNALAAGLRTAFVAMPPQYAEDLRKGNSDINVMASPLASEITAQLIQSGTAEKIVKEKRRILNRRNRLVNECFLDYTVKGDDCAQFRWLLLPSGWTGRQFEAAAYAKGVQVFSSERFVVGSAAVPPAVRLAISTPQSEAALDEGLKVLRALL